MNLPNVLTHKNVEPIRERILDDPYFQVGTPAAGSTRPGKFASQPVVLEFPMGELAGSGLKSLALLNGRLRPAEHWVANLTGDEGFAAQGLEGKVCVPMPLYLAIIRMDLLPEHRGRILTGGD